MSFKIITDRRFKWPIRINVPTEQGTRQQEFTANFLELGQDQLNKAIKDSDHSDTKFLAKLLVGWEDVFDDDGVAIPFNDAWKKRILNIPYVRTALLRAYLEAMTGAASEKN